MRLAASRVEKQPRRSRRESKNVPTSSAVSCRSKLWQIKRERTFAVSVFSQGSFEIRRKRWILRSCRSTTSIGT